jgi:hypothetical protein
MSTGSEANPENNEDVFDLRAVEEELWRQSEEIEAQPKGVGWLERTPFPLDAVDELERMCAALDAAKHLGGGKITAQRKELIAEAAEARDRVLEELKARGEVELVMAARASDEALMMGHSALASCLAQDAFRAANKGLSSEQCADQHTDAN